MDTRSLINTFRIHLGCWCYLAGSVSGCLAIYKVIALTAFKLKGFTGYEIFGPWFMWATFAVIFALVATWCFQCSKTFSMPEIAVHSCILLTIAGFLIGVLPVPF